MREYRKSIRRVRFPRDRANRDGDYARSLYRAETSGDSIRVFLKHREGEREVPPRTAVVRIITGGSVLTGEGDLSAGIVVSD